MKDAAWRRPFEADPELKLWHQTLARASEATADERARTLWRFCKNEKTTPQDLITAAKADIRTVENLVQHRINDLHAKGRSPSYQVNHVKAVKCWLEHNNLRMERRFRILDVDSTPTLADEVTPNPTELGEILHSATPRGRVAIAFVALAGLRPKTLGDYRGKDGLRIRDLPDLSIVGNRVEFTRIPCMVLVRKNLSKNRRQYFTFLGRLGCEILKAELEQRMAGGEVLTPDSPILRVSAGFERRGKPGAEPREFIVARNVTREIREAMGARFPGRPYVLRCYFATQVQIAEAQRQSEASFRAFWMGHKGDIEARYSISKHRLPPAAVEELRSAFERCCGFLEPNTRPPGPDPAERILGTLLQVAGYDEKQVQEANVAGKSHDEIIAMFRDAPLGGWTRPVAVPGGTQKVVTLDALESEMASGWIFKASLSDGRVILERVPTA